MDKSYSLEGLYLVSRSADAHARSKDVKEAEMLLDHLISASVKDQSLTPDWFSFQSVCVLQK